MNKYKKAVRALIMLLLAGTMPVPGGMPVQTVCAAESTTNAPDALLKEQRLNMWYSQAIESINDSDFENALLCLDACIAACSRESNPALYADLYLKRGYCYVMTGRNEDAIEALEEALDTDPELENAILLKVSAYSEMGMYPESIEALEQYIGLTDDSAMYETMAALYEAVGDTDKAADCYEKFVQGTGENENQSAFETGVYLMQRGLYEKAIEYLNKSLEGEEPADGAYFKRGMCYMSLGDYETAIADFGCSVEAEETDAGEALYNKATCEMTLLDYENAITDFSSCIDQEIEAGNSRVSRGICRLLSGNAQEALDDFNECIGQEMNTEEARFYRSYVYLAEKEYEQALTDLTACIENKYDLAASYLQRAQVYKEMGDEEAYQADIEASRNAQEETE